MSEWISVEEQMPERGDVIAYSTQYGDILIGWIAETESEGIVCYGDGCMMYHVTHWQPLPEPPGEEGESNASDN